MSSPKPGLPPTCPLRLYRVARISRGAGAPRSLAGAGHLGVCEVCAAFPAPGPHTCAPTHSHTC